MIFFYKFNAVTPYDKLPTFINPNPTNSPPPIQPEEKKKKKTKKNTIKSSITYTENHTSSSHFDYLINQSNL